MTRAMWRQFRSKGPGWAVRAAFDRLEEWVLERYYERRLGISTRGRHSREELGYAEPDSGFYGPSAYGNIRRIMRALGVEGGREVLIDLGSGKGRVVALAALHPFRRIVGVERSAWLADVGRANLARARHRFVCGEIELVTMDAAVYPLPDDATIVYFASPFSGAVLDAVLDNIQSSLMRAPRPLTIVSHGFGSDNPFERRLRECGWLALRREVPLQRSNSAWFYANSRWNTSPAATVAPTSA